MDAEGQGDYTGARNAWKDIRTQIHGYEQKLLELQFDYQQKVNVVEGLKLELRQITEDSRKCEEKAHKLVADAHAAYKTMQDLDKELMRAEKDGVLLTQQLVVEQQGLAADKAKIREAQQCFAQHTEEQQKHISHLMEQLQQQDPDSAAGAVVGATMCSAAAGAACNLPVPAALV